MKGLFHGFLAVAFVLAAIVVVIHLNCMGYLERMRPDPPCGSGTV